MSRLLAKIMLALLMFPLAVVVYVVTIMTIALLFYQARPPDVAPFLITSVIVWCFMAFYWVLLWRGTVIWTTRRIVLTVAVAGGALIPGTLCGLAGSVVDRSFGAFLGGVITIVCWLTATIFVWRETRQEHVDRIRLRGADVIVCPGCGYNMTGLRETTCPECGGSYTIDQLAALQPGRDEMA